MIFMIFLLSFMSLMGAHKEQGPVTLDDIQPSPLEIVGGPYYQLLAEGRFDAYRAVTLELHKSSFKDPAQFTFLYYCHARDFIEKTSFKSAVSMLDDAMDTVENNTRKVLEQLGCPSETVREACVQLSILERIALFVDLISSAEDGSLYDQEATFAAESSMTRSLMMQLCTLEKNGIRLDYTMRPNGFFSMGEFLVLMQEGTFPIVISEPSFKGSHNFCFQDVMTHGHKIAESLLTDTLCNQKSAYYPFKEFIDTFFDRLPKNYGVPTMKGVAAGFLKMHEDYWRRLRVHTAFVYMML